MFNVNERKKIWISIGKGALVGGILCIVIFVYSLFADTWNCLCECVSDSHRLPEINSWLTFLFAFLICLIIGLMVGFFSAINERSNRIAKENEQKLQEEKRKLAKEEKAKNDRYAANHHEMIMLLENLKKYADNSVNSIYKQFDEIQFVDENKKSIIEDDLIKCKQRKTQTENIANKYRNKESIQ